MVETAYRSPRTPSGEIVVYAKSEKQEFCCTSEIVEFVDGMLRLGVTTFWLDILTFYPVASHCFFRLEERKIVFP